MCWNAEVSLQSFLIGAVAIGIAYSKGLSLPTTLFCISITCMQLVEYFTWSYYGNPRVNFVASVAAFLLLWMQPIASMLTLPNDLLRLSIGIYIGISTLGILFDAQPSHEKFKMVRESNGHLSWGFLQKNRETYISLFLYFFFLFFPLVLSERWGLLSIVLLTLSVSLYNFFKSNTWGSMWCWIVNYIVVGVAIRQVLIAKP